MFCNDNLAGNGNNNNDNDNDGNNIIFTLKDTKLYVPVVTLSSRENQNISKLLSKGLKDQFIGMNIKQKIRIKVRQMNLDIWSNQVLLESIDYLF